MKRDRSRPPRWFVPAVLIGSTIVGAVAAVVIASSAS